MCASVCQPGVGKDNQLSAVDLCQLLFGQQPGIAGFGAAERALSVDRSDMDWSDVDRRLTQIPHRFLGHTEIAAVAESHCPHGAIALQQTNVDPAE